jgi:glyoxylase-like metal-dependent hydrolase (beta-lactamase superfamily II)
MSDSQKSAPAPKGLTAAIVLVTPFQQNCTLIWDAETKKGAVIDPGGDLELIEKAIAEVGMKPEKILLTHGHIDHAGGAAELRERLGVPIEGPHEAERPLLDALEAQGQAYGMEARAVTPDRWLAEGDAVTVAGHTFEVLHRPGHSPGRSCSSTVRSGSPSSATCCSRAAAARTPPGNHEALMTSIRSKLLPLGDDFAFICGHGPTSTIGQERRTNPFIAGNAGSFYA